MTFTVPSWLLWALAIVVGVPATVALIGLAVFGWIMAKSFKGGIWK